MVLYEIKKYIKNNFKRYKNVFYYIIGSFFVQGLSFITLPIFSNILSPKDFGYYASYCFWISILYIFVGVQIYATINNAIIDFEEKNIYGYLSSICSFGILSFFLVLLLVCIGQSWISKLFELNVNILIIGVIQALFNFFVVTLTSLYRVLCKPLGYLIFSIIVAFLDISLSILIIVFIQQDKYMGRIYGSLISFILVGAIAVFNIYKKGKEYFNVNFIKYGLSISVPLVIHSLASVMMTRIDQFMILKFISVTESGIYAFGSNFGHIIYVLYTASNYAFTPWYFKMLNAVETEKINIKIKKYIFYVISVLSIVILVLPEIIKLMSNHWYYSAIYFAPLIAVGFCINFLYTFFVNFETYKKQTKYIAIGTVMTSTANVILNIVFIPKYHAVGAAVATLISCLLQFVFHSIISKKIIGSCYIDLEIFKKCIIFLMFLLTVFYLFINIFLLRCVLIVIIATNLLWNAYQNSKKGSV